MPEIKDGAKPAQITTTATNARDRRDQFAMAFGAAVLQRGQGRTPRALAAEIIPFVDAFLELLDASAK